MQIVSIIIPCYNEQSRIFNLLSAIYAQTYPREQIEVVIADGGSTDQTRPEIDRFTVSTADLRVLVIDNPKQIIPSGLNLAIRASKGEIIIRLDAHSQPYPDYILRCVEALTFDLGENVGGVWEILPGDDSWLAQSIAKAASLPVAVGDAYYRYATKPAYVDTVPFGAFKREIFAINGFFDESLETNEDYEFNTRIKGSGGRIWLDPLIRSKYYARSNLLDLSKQYGRYGFWKWKMLERYPRTMRWRQALPPLFLLSLIITTIMAAIFPSFWFIPVGEFSLYLLLLIFIGVVTAFREKRFFYLAGIPLAISSMHISWGLGLIWSMIMGKTRSS